MRCMVIRTPSVTRNIEEKTGWSVPLSTRLSARMSKYAGSVSTNEVKRCRSPTVQPRRARGKRRRYSSRMHNNAISVCFQCLIMLRSAVTFIGRSSW